jgi:hypothetical protein
MDATSQGWYGRLDVGWVSGGVLVRAGWWLPLGWQGVPVSEFGELYGWWEGLGDWVIGQALEDVSVRHRGEEKELDGYVKVLLGAARWYVGDSELRSVGVVGRCAWWGAGCVVCGRTRARTQICPAGLPRVWACCALECWVRVYYRWEAGD